MEDCLYHHGIKGQRWGIRRYQDYDGTYTQAGLRRYYKAKDNYDEAKEKLNKAKETKDKTDISKARTEYSIAKQKEQKAYKQLSNDMKADKGKKLYSEGKTITSNETAETIAKVIGSIGVTALSMSAKNYNDKGNASVTNALAAIGTLGVSVAAATYVKKESENKNLRAYYAH